MKEGDLVKYNGELYEAGKTKFKTVELKRVDELGNQVSVKIFEGFVRRVSFNGFKEDLVYEADFSKLGVTSASRVERLEEVEKMIGKESKKLLFKYDEVAEKRLGELQEEYWKLRTSKELLITKEVKRLEEEKSL